MNYIIGLGWWCDGSGKTEASKWNNSTDEIRRVGFFDDWYRSVSKNTNPVKIVAVDSKSPIKPDFAALGIETIEMVGNYLHPDFGLKYVSAATRQVFMGAWYAFFNKAEYFVWVEQDCLLHGEGIIERAIENMGDADYSMGTWRHEYKLETCFMVFRCASLMKILQGFLESTAPVPELRYWGLRNHLKFIPMPFGYGRNRPIKWDDEHFFAQHLTGYDLEMFRSIK